MGEHRYEIPGESSNWGSLSHAAQQAMTGITAEKPVAAELIVNHEAEGQLVHEIQGALDSWKTYGDIIGYGVPTVNEILQRDGNKIAELQTVKDGLYASGEETPMGENLGDSMHLVLIPWLALRDNLEQLPTWLHRMAIHRSQFAPPSIETELWEAIDNDDMIYHYPGSQVSTQTVRNYVALKTSFEGPWGLMLAQTSDDAGIKRLLNAFNDPNTLTGSFSKRFSIDDQPVSYMGILEWLAVILQEGTDDISSSDKSWLLANRFHLDGETCTPTGNFSRIIGKSVVSAAKSDHSNKNIRPRLAVL